MSLQVWLPLNGDLHNQGLNNISFINGETDITIDNSGKIGKCCSFNYDKKIGFTLSDLNNIQQFSICFWMNPVDWGRTYITPVIFSNANSWSNSCGFSTYAASDTDSIAFVVSNGTNYKAAYVSKSRIPKNAWTNVIGTYGGRYLKVYLNGTLITTTDAGTNFNIIFPTTGHIGGWHAALGTSSGYSGKINDVRLYDHALSTKEVEEIAKGLVLHYKLDNNGMGGENLFSLDSVYSSQSKTTVTVYNNIINVKSSGVNYGAFSQVPANRITFEAGVTYVLSGHIKSITKGEDNYSPRLTIRRSDNGNILKTLTVSGNESDVEGTYTPNSTFLGYIAGLVSYSSGSTNTIIAEAEFSYIKLEKGTKKTNWSPAPQDTIYPVNYSTTIYDSSGYSNNGTVVGSLTAAAPSPRYNVATYGSTDGYILCNQKLVLINPTQFTISFWIKTTIDGYPIVLHHLTNYFRVWIKGDTFYFRDADSGTSNGAGKTISIGTWRDGNWHHIVVAYDSTVVKSFNNGQKIQEKNIVGPYLTSIYKIYLLGQQINDTYAFDGTISDFRLYVTSLSDKAIKELYNTSMSIDSNGNVYARELVEL